MHTMMCVVDEMFSMTSEMSLQQDIFIGLNCQGVRLSVGN